MEFQDAAILSAKQHTISQRKKYEALRNSHDTYRIIKSLNALVLRFSFDDEPEHIWLNYIYTPAPLGKFPFPIRLPIRLATAYRQPALNFTLSL